MDYTDLKKTVETENNLNRQKFLNAYEQQEEYLITTLTSHILTQIKGAVRNYYKYPMLKDDYIRRHVIKKPTLFRRYYVYESNSSDAIFKQSDDWSGPFDRLYSTTNYWDVDIPCVHIPASKFRIFFNLLKQQLEGNDVQIALIPNGYGGWYNIHITANLGQL